MREMKNIYGVLFGTYVFFSELTNKHPPDALVSFN